MIFWKVLLLFHWIVFGSLLIGTTTDALTVDTRRLLPCQDERLICSFLNGAVGEKPAVACYSWTRQDAPVNYLVREKSWPAYLNKDIEDISRVTQSRGAGFRSECRFQGKDSKQFYCKTYKQADCMLHNRAVCGLTDLWLHSNLTDINDITAPKCRLRDAKFKQTCIYARVVYSLPFEPHSFLSESSSEGTSWRLTAANPQSCPDSLVNRQNDLAILRVECDFFGDDYYCVGYDKRTCITSPEGQVGCGNSMYWSGKTPTLAPIIRLAPEVIKLLPCEDEHIICSFLAGAADTNNKQLIACKSWTRQDAHVNYLVQEKSWPAYLDQTIKDIAAANEQRGSSFIRTECIFQGKASKQYYCKNYNSRNCLKHNRLVCGLTDLWLSSKLTDSNEFNAPTCRLRDTTFKQTCVYARVVYSLPFEPHSYFASSSSGNNSWQLTPANPQSCPDSIVNRQNDLALLRVECDFFGEEYYCTAYDQRTCNISEGEPKSVNCGASMYWAGRTPTLMPIVRLAPEVIKLLPCEDEHLVCSFLHDSTKNDQQNIACKSWTRQDANVNYLIREKSWPAYLDQTIKDIAAANQKLGTKFVRSECIFQGKASKQYYCKSYKKTDCLRHDRVICGLTDLWLSSNLTDPSNQPAPGCRLRDTTYRQTCVYARVVYSLPFEPHPYMPVASSGNNSWHLTPANPQSCPDSIVNTQNDLALLRVECDFFGQEYYCTAYDKRLCNTSVDGQDKYFDCGHSMYWGGRTPDIAPIVELAPEVISLLPCQDEHLMCSFPFGGQQKATCYTWTRQDAAVNYLIRQDSWPEYLDQEIKAITSENLKQGNVRKECIFQGKDSKQYYCKSYKQTDCLRHNRAVCGLTELGLNPSLNGSQDCRLRNSTFRQTCVYARVVYSLPFEPYSYLPASSSESGWSLTPANPQSCPDSIVNRQNDLALLRVECDFFGPDYYCTAYEKRACETTSDGHYDCGASMFWAGRTPDLPPIIKLAPEVVKLLPCRDELLTCSFLSSDTSLQNVTCYSWTRQDAQVNYLIRQKTWPTYLDQEIQGIVLSNKQNDVSHARTECRFQGKDSKQYYCKGYQKTDCLKHNNQICGLSDIWLNPNITDARQEELQCRMRNSTFSKTCIYARVMFTRPFETFAFQSTTPSETSWNLISADANLCPGSEVNGKDKLPLLRVECDFFGPDYYCAGYNKRACDYPLEDQKNYFDCGASLYWSGRA